MRSDLDKLELLALAASPGGRTGLFRSDLAADQIEQFAESLKHGTGRLWCVFVPVDDETPIEETAKYTAITGNGPTSEANARFYSVARENTLALIANLRIALDDNTALLARDARCSKLSAAVTRWRVERKLDEECILDAAGTIGSAADHRLLQEIAVALDEVPS